MVEIDQRRHQIRKAMLYFKSTAKNIYPTQIGIEDHEDRQNSPIYT